MVFWTKSPSRIPRRSGKGGRREITEEAKSYKKEQELPFPPVRDFQYPPKSGAQGRKREKHSLPSSDRLPGSPKHMLNSGDRRCFSKSALVSASRGLCLDPDKATAG